MSKFNFKSAGRLFNNAKMQSQVDLEVLDNRKPIGIMTPIQLASDDKSTLFQQSFDIVDQIRDNLRNLILTSKGERLGRYDLGSSVRDLTFELVASDEEYESLIMQKIKETVSRYMPYISLKSLTTDKYLYSREVDENLVRLSLEINYDIPKLSVKNQKINIVLYIAG